MFSFTRSNILSWALAFVIVWFGFHELLQPADWVVFVPTLFGNGSFATDLIYVHGIVLIISALCLVLDYHRRIVSGLLVLILAEIVIELISTSGLSDMAVRDIGLFGMALANSLKSNN